jgi:hypothetical protein
VMRLAVTEGTAGWNSGRDISWISSWWELV